MSLKDLGEFGLIDRIASHATAGHGVVTGIGDDAAVTALSPGMQLLTSTDMLLEGVHFRRVWHDPRRLGRKSLAVNISDIAAMGGIPRWALLSLAVPADLSVEYLDDFTDGFLSMAAEHGVTLIGGDTCASSNGLIISVTMMGEQSPEKIVRRSGARPGDDIWVTGTLGDAAFGLSLLESSQSGNAPQPPSNLPLEGGEVRPSKDIDEYFVSRLLDPSPRTRTGKLLAESGLITAMIDISDGLLADFGHIAEMSAVGGVIQLDALPLSGAFRQSCAQDPDALASYALAGGEDYELAFTCPPSAREKIKDIMKKCGISFTRVGIVTEISDVNVLQANGAQYNLQLSGFNHFR